jgi:hypothetical protein
MCPCPLLQHHPGAHAASAKPSIDLQHTLSALAHAAVFEWLCSSGCVPVAVFLWLCSCGCVHVAVFMWLCSCVCCRWLSLLVYSMARLKLRPPPAWQQQIVAAMTLHLGSSSNISSSKLAANITQAPASKSPSSSSSSSSVRRQTFSGRDLCLLLWALPGLSLHPPAPLLTRALQASRHSLADLDCSYLTALLVRG